MSHPLPLNTSPRLRIRLRALPGALGDVEGEARLAVQLQVAFRLLLHLKRPVRWQSSRTPRKHVRQRRTSVELITRGQRPFFYARKTLRRLPFLVLVSGERTVSISYDYIQR